MDAFVFGTAPQAAKSDGPKGITSGVGSGSDRFLVTQSSLVCLVGFPCYNLTQCLEICLEVIKYITITWAHKIIVEEKYRDSSRVTTYICY